MDAEAAVPPPRYNALEMGDSYMESLLKGLYCMHKEKLGGSGE